MQADGNPGWTDERIERLTSLWMDGYSATQCARALGWVTRSAVIGKVHRLHLRRPGQAPRISGRRLVIAHDSPLPYPSRPSPRATARRSASPAYSGRLALSPVMETLGIPLLELRECHCRWPLDGDPRRADFGGFCGRPKADGLPYCDGHSRRAFQPSRPRQPSYFRLEALYG
jgi:GcrA cell cycle regulator